jgi:ribosome-binding protein aMBF1 (putative translation factor)
MAKADRLARLDLRRSELEAEYTAVLIEALRTTAAGKWGLFDHKADRQARAAIAPTLDNLNEIGQAIDRAREQLGMAPFELQQEFLASRGAVNSHAVGEPRQAQAWLDRIAAATAKS